MPMPAEVPQPDDNWKHRSSNMRCSTCIWYVPKRRDDDGGITIKDLHRQLGRCRRHAPTISGFPAVFSSDWCGDHKIDENKT